MEKLQRILHKKKKTAIGLMSGTSVDGIDAVLADIESDFLSAPEADKTASEADAAGCTGNLSRPGSIRIKERAFITAPYPRDVQKRLLDIASGSFGGSAELCAMNFYLGELFADACFEVCRTAGIPISEVDFIGSHGHTVFHAPEPQCIFGKNIQSTLQIGEAAVIAERTGCLTVSDFRVRDTAAGGFGAPLVPFTEYLLYGEPGKTIALQNIGGIGNITILPAHGSIHDITAFDTGPGNMLLDGLVRIITGDKAFYDEDARLASKGVMDEGLLAFLKSDPYPYKKPPKTTGREYYSHEFIQRIYKTGTQAGLSGETILRTTARYTAFCIAHSCTAFNLPYPDTLIVGGGGSKNPVILEDLRSLLPGCRVITNEDAGKNSDSKEAAAFAILAHETLYGKPNNVPAATGARHFAVMGKISI